MYRLTSRDNNERVLAMFGSNIDVMALRDQARGSFDSLCEEARDDTLESFPGEDEGSAREYFSDIALTMMFGDDLPTPGFVDFGVVELLGDYMAAEFMDLVEDEWPAIKNDILNGVEL